MGKTENVLLSGDAVPFDAKTQLNSTPMKF